MKELYQILKGEIELPFDLNDIDQVHRKFAINFLLGPWANIDGANLDSFDRFGIKKSDVSACRNFLKDLKNGTFKFEGRKRGKMF
jgi:hypothetical protein